MRHTAYRYTSNPLGPYFPVPRSPFRVGFTLIELLVVVAIIVALLAILMPSMGRAVELAHRTVCASNQHQTHLAHIAWAADHFGSFVEGQPSFHLTGHYAVWGRTGFPVTAGYEEYGRYRKHGVLVRRGYLPDGKMFYCPSWTGAIGWEKTGSVYGPSNPGGGWFEDEADVPGTQTWMQTTYHYNSMFGSDKYRHVNGWRSANLSMDKGSAALMSDAFSDPTRGIKFHHQDGYNVLRLDGAATFFDDPDHDIDNINAGITYHSGEHQYKELQSKAWRTFEGRE